MVLKNGVRPLYGSLLRSKHVKYGDVTSCKY